MENVQEFPERFKLNPLRSFEEQRIDDLEILYDFTDEEINNFTNSIGDKIKLKRAIGDLKKTDEEIEDIDFSEFDYVFGMDMNNISNLRGQQPPGSKAKVLLLGEFDPEGDRIIRDPYYDSGSDGFEKCYQQCVRSCNAFLDQVAEGKV